MNIHNKKGFSLVEILAVIVIIGMLSTTAIVGVSYIINKSRKESFEKQEKMLLLAAENYFRINSDYMPKDIGDIEEVDAQTLYDKHYLKSKLTNSKKEDCMENSYAEIHKSDKKNYEYKAYIYCGSDTRPINDAEVPEVVIRFTADDDGDVGISYTDKLKLAKVIIEMNGGFDEDTNSLIPIEGYSFSIAAKTNPLIDHYYEVYNSGSLNGGLEKEITVEKKLKDYLDITSSTEIKVSVTVNNNKGKKITVSNSTADNYEDKTKPFCSDILIEANDNDGWINAHDYFANGKIRKISVVCNDKNGSGCIRNRYTKSWPNKQQHDAEYGYVQVKDNAGNVNIDDSYITGDDCKTYKSDTCRVKVNVDTTYPTIKVEAYKRDSNGKKTGDNLIKSGTTSQVGGNSSLNAPKATISYNQYDNLSNNWMGNNNFPHGIIYKVTISDNLHLARWEWKTNKPYLTSRNDDFDKFGSGSEKDSGEIDDSSFKNNSNCGPTTANSFYVYLEEEGMRKGRITLTDKAGNKTTFYLEAYIDRTAPPKPSVKFKKYNSSNTSVSNTDYTLKTWSKLYVASIGVNPGDKKAKGGDKTLSADLSGFSKFKHKGSTESGTIEEAEGNLNFASSLYEGKNKIQYKACDKAGNCSKYTDLYEVWIDTIAPTINLKAYRNNTINVLSVDANDSNTSVTVNYSDFDNTVNGWMNKAYYPTGVKYEISMSDNIKLSKYKWDSSENSVNNVSKTITKTITTDGYKDNTITAYDIAGNTSKIHIYARIDKEPPSWKTSLDCSQTDSDGKKLTSPLYEISDALSGVASHDNTRTDGETLRRETVSEYNDYYGERSYTGTCGISTNTDFPKGKLNKIEMGTSSANKYIYVCAIRACDKAGNCKGRTNNECNCQAPVKTFTCP